MHNQITKKFTNNAIIIKSTIQFDDGVQYAHEF